MTTSPQEMQETLDQLQTELATRASTHHFAHAGVSIVAALIVAAAAAKLCWDSPKHYWIGLSVGAVAVALWIRGTLYYRLGKRLLCREIERFELLKSLRRTLGLDDPSALLPQQ